jgi:hypothetical protein
MKACVQQHFSVATRMLSGKAAKVTSNEWEIFYHGSGRVNVEFI